VDRLGRDMADTEPHGAAAATPVGDQRTVTAAAGTLQCPRDGQHLTHARAAFRPLVADDLHCAGLDAAREDRLHGRLLAVESAGDTVETHLLLGEACDLDHRPLRSEGPA